MKKYFIISITAAILCAVALIYSCKKTSDDQQDGCGTRASGIYTPPQAIITFYITKDLGCGKINFFGIKYAKTGGTFNAANGGVIDRYYSTAPACGNNTTGTAWVQVAQGDTYEYTLNCTNRTYTGTVSVACGETCKLVEVK